MKKILFLPVLTLFLTGINVQAEEEVIAVPTLIEATTSEGVVVEVAGTEVVGDNSVSNPEGTIGIELESIPENSQGIGEEVRTMSSFGLWWRGIKENFSLTFTFDAEKRADKVIAFAEERMKIAEEFLANSDDEGVIAKAEKVMERAQELLKKAETKKVEVQEKVQARLDEVETKVEEHKIKIEEYKNKQEELRNRIKEGDESAKLELKELNTEIRNEMIQNREEIDARRESVKIELQKRAEAGDPQAETRLQQMEERGEQIGKLIQERAQENYSDPIREGIEGGVMRMRGTLNTTGNQENN
ncbi:MAG: hypothetical protein V1851_00490 [Patescibacteria group bacterium]